MLDSLTEMPSDLLVNYARRIGIDPTQYERSELIDKFKQQTEDYKTVMGLKKARQDNREYNAEFAANQKALKLQQAAHSNRQKYFGFMMGGEK